MLRIIPRSETLLPSHPDSYYRGPFEKRGICWHHMGAHESYPVIPGRALQIQRVNHDYQVRRWKARDIIEGYDLILVDSGHGMEAWALEGRPSWSDCDAFSGASKLGYPYIGVEVAGNYNVDHPRDEMLQAMAELAAALHLQGKCGTDFHHGHRDFNYLSNVGPSDCPGNNLYPHLGEVEKEALRIIRRGAKEEVEPMLAIAREVEKQGDKFVQVIPDAYYRLGDEQYRCFLVLKNESDQEAKVEVYGTPYFSEPFRVVLGSWERRVIDCRGFYDGSLDGGFSLTIKSTNPNVVAAVSILPAR